MKKINLGFLIGIILIAACGNTDDSKPEGGAWRGILETPGGELPFNFNLIYKNDSLTDIAMANGKDIFMINEFELTEDSIFFKFPVFDSEIRARISSSRTMEGLYFDYSREDYSMPFRAEYGNDYRFTGNPDAPATDVSGRWEATFADQDKAVGQFIQEGNQILGTFLTPTGDYRYLEGNISGDSLYLSSFDGSHAFLFKAKAGDTLRGMFYSGKHAQIPWMAIRNEYFELPHADTLTFINPGYEFSFAFPDTDSNLVSLNDPGYQNKVRIIQIMGTWCPNCKDQTAFLSEYYKQHQDKGLEVISLAFERTRDFDRAVQNINRMKQRYNIPYKVLYAGNANKDEAAQALPMLNHVMSYPTTIFIDRNGEVRRIHTGFAGPATGAPYERHIREFDEFVQALLKEEQPS